MHKICVKNMGQIFRNISEMCVEKFRNFRCHFYVCLHRKYSESRQFSQKLWKIMLAKISKLFEISSGIIFHNFLPLHCKQIFHVHVTLGQICKKNLMFMTYHLFDHAIEKNIWMNFFVVIGVWCQS